MDHRDSPPVIPEDLDLSDYTNWLEIFRSWFWRYYDHLGRSLALNLAWILSCVLVCWFPVREGWLRKDGGLDFPAVLVLYFLVSFLSVGWAYSIFKLFIHGAAGKGDWREGVRKFWLKGTLVSLFTGLVFCAALYSARFFFLLNGQDRFLYYAFAGLAVWFALFWLAAALYQWPILFFQDPPLHKVYYRSFLLTVGNGSLSAGMLFFLALSFLFFFLAPFLWLFAGTTYFFSFLCVALEKQLLKYKITYNGTTLDAFLVSARIEKERGWKDILKPWENR